MANESRRTFLIAEVGSVHDGSFGNAMKLIEAVADAGADAVKFQTHIPEAETLPDAPAPPFFDSEPRFEYFRRTGFDLEEWKSLKTHAEKHELVFLSSPFSIESVELLEETGISRYKIPSGEVTNIPLLRKIATTEKPVFLSSGMSSWTELDRAVEVFVSRDINLTVLQCTSAYPCAPERVGLNVLTEMKERYGTAVGLSDHTMGLAASLAAVSFGAAVVERHFTFSRRMYGSDARHSLEPEEFKQLMKEIRMLERMLSNPVDKRDTSDVKTMKATFEKSLVARVNIEKGEVITEEKLAILKPGTGISPRFLERIIGQRASRDIEAKEVLNTEDIAGAKL